MLRYENSRGAKLRPALNNQRPHEVLSWIRFRAKDLTYLHVDTCLNREQNSSCTFCHVREFPKIGDPNIVP